MKEEWKWVVYEDTDFVDLQHVSCHNSHVMSWPNSYGKCVSCDKSVPPKMYKVFKLMLAVRGLL